MQLAYPFSHQSSTKDSTTSRHLNFLSARKDKCDRFTQILTLQEIPDIAARESWCLG
ncbi:hypothetical protein [Coleofasciculus sp. FACHB-T130]|uniref:hypothetical protein n=1 Tax=Cyanophyceae TaxID=3028117 RepID=UPI001684FE8F|nr:hypothetical protein [Coleofasciculus sp. FACHB-T130]MBD1881064.1 hypothetical protein [Coleofasciculus sp. FACHB-T130]